MVNNCATQRKLQALAELHQESNPREQSRHRDWNPDWGSLDKISRRWQSVGDYGAGGDEYGGGVGGVVSVKEITEISLSSPSSKFLKFSILKLGYDQRSSDYLLISYTQTHFEVQPAASQSMDLAAKLDQL